MSLISFALCSIFNRNDAKRDAGLVTPDDIIRYDNILYGPDEKWNQLDVYRPRSACRPLPIIVSVHGGGWVYGDKERYQYYCMSLAQHGFAVVNFTYRLAPKHKFPAPLEDTARVFSWVHENVREYDLDAKHVFGVGDSVGAHLLALFCCLCTNPAYAAVYPFNVPEDHCPLAVALNCGTYEFEKGKGGISLLIRDFLEEKGSDEELERIRVADHVSSAFPPCFIMTCEGDFMAAAARPMAEKLSSLGVPVEYRYYGDKDTVLGHVFHCNVRSREATLCNREECEFFLKYC